MEPRPRGLAVVIGMTAVGLAALALTGLMETVSAGLFLILELLAESLRSLRGRARRRPRRAWPRAGPAPARPIRPATIHRARLRRRGRPRRPGMGWTPPLA